MNRNKKKKQTERQKEHRTEGIREKGRKIKDVTKIEKGLRGVRKNI